MQRIEIHVKGKVQGVSFRAATQQVAQRLEVFGYAKNESDGSVTIIGEGEEANLQKLLNWATQGPDVARVDEVTHSWVKPTGYFDHFSTL